MVSLGVWISSCRWQGAWSTLARSVDQLTLSQQSSISERPNSSYVLHPKMLLATLTEKWHQLLPAKLEVMEVNQEPLDLRREKGKGNALEGAGEGGRERYRRDQESLSEVLPGSPENVSRK